MECYGLPAQALHALYSSWQDFQGDWVLHTRSGTQKISWVSWKSGLKHYKNGWWASESWIQLSELELLTVSACQGPEEATQPKMEAQCVQSMIKTCQYLSTYPTCLGCLHALLLTFLAHCWYSRFCCYLSHQRSILPQSIGQFVLFGSCLICVVHEKSWTQARNLQPQEEGRTL